MLHRILRTYHALIRRFWSHAWLSLLFIFLYTPLGLVMFLSFNKGASAAHWEGFSFKWYRVLCANHLLLKAMMTSIYIALCVAFMATILGLSMAMILRRLRFSWLATAVRALSHAPLFMPEIILGLGFLLLFVSAERWIGWPQGRGALTVIIAHATLAASYVTVMMTARLMQIDSCLEQAALDLGARPWRVFCDITLPMLMPSLATGWLLSFALSFDDVVIASFTAGPGTNTLPMFIFSNLRLGITPQLNALATMIVGVIMTSIALLSVHMIRKSKNSIQN